MAAVLKWKHELDKREAKRILRREIKDRGYGKYVMWEAFGFSVSAGPLGALLNASGEITDEHIVINKVSGLLSGKAEQETRKLLRDLFPA